MHSIRRAISSDASKLATLQEQTFRDTFAATNDPVDMALYCRTHYSPELQAREINNPELMTLVCDLDNELIGFAQLRKGESPECIAANRPVEIQRLYIDKAWHGKGLAQQFMARCIAEALALGADRIWLGVWEKNPRAIRFYQKFGFAAVGSHVFMVGSDAQRDLIMLRQ